MKVLAEREKLLSNFEVYEHLKEIQIENHWRTNEQNQKKHKRSFNPDHETVTGEVTSYLSKSPTENQTIESIIACMKDLSKFSLEKIEKLQIINSTPHSLVNLYAIVEECDQRFSEDEIQQILDLVQRHFPQDEEEEDEEDGDVNDNDEAPEHLEGDVDMS